MCASVRACMWVSGRANPFIQPPLPPPPPRDQVHPWVTRNGAEPLPPEDDNCCMLIEVTEEEVENSVKHIPSLATVVRSPHTRTPHTPHTHTRTRTHSAKPPLSVHEG